MSLISFIRTLLLRNGINSRALVYAKPYKDSEIRAIQLALWNAEWERVRNQVPYYQRLSQENKLPSQFSTWEEFIETVPVTSRTVVKDNTSVMISTGQPPNFMRITGGTTAEPIQMPSWKSENEFTNYDMWMARSWFGIRPSSRLFLIWGHSHLLGAGLDGLLNAYKRKIFDRLLDYFRFSAYDLRDEEMKRAGDQLLYFKPDYVVGYSMALDRFARVNINRKNELRKIGLKVVIGAAERFPAPDTVELLYELFGCPVAMEYGSVETGLMAHLHPDGKYRVFWKTYFLEAEKKNDSDAVYTVRITSLYPRCLPLIRYEIGDEILINCTKTSNILGVVEFDSVLGRCNDYVKLTDGSLIHSEAFTHAVRWCPVISGYQVIQDGKNICIQYTSLRELDREIINSISTKLKAIHPQLESIPIKRIDHLEQTVAGKTNMIIIK